MWSFNIPLLTFISFQGDSYRIKVPLNKYREDCATFVLTSNDYHPNQQLRGASSTSLLRHSSRFIVHLALPPQRTRSSGVTETRPSHSGARSCPNAHEGREIYGFESGCQKTAVENFDLGVSENRRTSYQERYFTSGPTVPSMDLLVVFFLSFSPSSRSLSNNCPEVRRSDAVCNLRGCGELPPLVANFRCKQ